MLCINYSSVDKFPCCNTGTSSGTFVHSSEDRSRALDFIEDKIARATMIPKSHGEVLSYGKL